MKSIFTPHGKFFILFLFSLSLNFLAKAELCTALLNGNWSEATTWSCGHSPTDNDTMWIPAGFVVTVDINSPEYKNMLVIVDGTLNFDNGQKINICPGGVYVSATGEISGGNPGSKINICGATVWNGPDAVRGIISFGSVTLPVELISFSGAQNSNSIALTWSTQTETNNHYFTLARSTNGLTYEEIGRVNGNGTSSQAHYYSFIDASPFSGTNYYKLTQTDFNGKQETFPLIAVEFANATPGCVLTVIPNPCEADCIVKLSDCPEDKDGNIAVQIIDATGKTVSTTIPERDAQGGFSYTLDINNNLKPGVYIVRGISSKSVYQQKAILK